MVFFFPFYLTLTIEVNLMVTLIFIFKYIIHQVPVCLFDDHGQKFQIIFFM